MKFSEKKKKKKSFAPSDQVSRSEDGAFGTNQKIDPIDRPARSERVEKAGDFARLHFRRGKVKTCADTMMAPIVKAAGKKRVTFI